MNDLYEAHCKKCYNKTPNMAIAVSRKYGVLLRCLKCGTSRTRYIKVCNLNKSQEIEE